MGLYDDDENVVTRAGGGWSAAANQVSSRHVCSDQRLLRFSNFLFRFPHFHAIIRPYRFEQNSNEKDRKKLKQGEFRRMLYKKLIH